MKQERMKILTMLEEGKITADDATKLLEVLSEGDSGFFSGDTAEQVEEKLQRFAKTVEGFAKEFGHKAGSAYKSVEPKLKSASRTVLEKTAALVDDISKSLHDSLEKPDEPDENSENPENSGASDENKPGEN